MRILFVAPECVPFSKTGGLADVAAALPRALADRGHHVLVVTPRYRGADPAKAPAGKVRVHLVENAAFFDRPGVYGEKSQDYADNHQRYAFFAREALEAARRLDFPPEIVHLHDWPAALAALYLRREQMFPGVKCVFTVHNLAHQGLFPASALAEVGLPREVFNWRELEFYGRVSFLKAGLVFADAVTTVSPRYAREIQTAEFGAGLDGLLRERAAAGAVHGILNGVEYSDWSPETDPHLAARYGPQDLSGKAACKAALQRELGLAERADVPLLGVVSRLAEQKGMDLIAAVAEELVARGAQLAVLGTGEPRLEQVFRELSDKHAGKVRARVGFDNGLAHRIEAGADLFLMPSRFEPCGLNQMYSLRYGAVPVVRAVGGLDDTVEDEVTGFKFAEASGAALLQACARALEAYRAGGERWTAMMRAGMAKDFSWAASAAEYEKLFVKIRA
jgi:starch synthase